jgi:hypothetical protein
MNKNKLHIGFRICAMVLAMAVLTPVGVKLAHSLNHHEHEVCQGYTETHFHSLDLDCEFYKFKLSKELTISVYNYQNNLNVLNSYFLQTLHVLPYTHQHLSYSLRAPPTLA